MTFISRNRIFRIGSHTSQAERWISEGTALSAVVYRCTSLGTRASGPLVRRMVGTDWEAISAVMVREPLAGKVCVSVMSWKRVAPVSALVLRRTAGTPSPSPWPPSAPTRGAEGGTWGAGANAWWPAHAMVGYARYEPHATSGFLIRLLGLLHTGDGVNKSYRQASGTCLRSFTQGRIWATGPSTRIYGFHE